MKVTISDVAKLAGVSTATVSHTINNTRYVSNETKEKVYRAIEELGYTPDASARSFRTGKKKIIGFIVPDIANKFFATMIESVEKYLSANGYQLIIANTRENMDREETNIRLLTAGLFMPGDNGCKRRPGAAGGCHTRCFRSVVFFVLSLNNRCVYCSLVACCNSLKF